MSFHRYQPSHLEQPSTAARWCVVGGGKIAANLRGFFDCLASLAEEKH